jgi:hypothetical protein
MNTVMNLGDEKLEDMIRQQIGSILKNHPTIRTSVMGSQNDDNWEVKVQNAANQKSWRAMLTLHDNQSAQKAVNFVKEGIASVK